MAENHSSKQLIYLASPYSHPDDGMRFVRFNIVCRVASKLMRAGHKVFSPIVHTHTIAEAGGLPPGWDFWEAYDRAVLAACREVWVLMLPGWETSHGVAAEVDIASELELTVRFLSPDGELL